MKPAAGQRPENDAHPPIKQLWAVFHDDDGWSYLANEAGELMPKPASFAIKSSATPAGREVLAGEAADDAVGLDPIGSKSSGGEFAHVIVTGYSRPMLRQHALAEWVDFAEGYRLEAARALEAQVEAADPCEKGQHLERCAARLIEARSVETLRRQGLGPKGESGLRRSRRAHLNSPLEFATGDAICQRAPGLVRTTRGRGGAGMNWIRASIAARSDGHPGIVQDLPDALMGKADAAADEAERLAILIAADDLGVAGAAHAAACCGSAS
jgi:hypothetical protein